MIPIIIITESGESFNYFEGLRKGEIEGESFSEYRIEDIRGEYVWRTEKDWLRNKVLDLLHKAVGDCFIYNINKTVQESTPLIQQYKFQIYLKDIVEKAKGEKG